MLTKRVTFDNWQIEARPEHGPALAIGEGDRIHIAWFTQGSVRKGLFYAYSKGHGQHFSESLPLGAGGRLASHPYVVAVGRHTVLVWLEFDGTRTQLKVMQSIDGGASWSAAKTLAESASANNHPALLQNGGQIYVAWNSVNPGYRLIAVN